MDEAHGPNNCLAIAIRDSITISVYRHNDSYIYIYIQKENYYFILIVFNYGKLSIGSKS